MTIKFNFYDIYGYALPGFLLLAVLWLPYGLIEHKWPDAEFSSALLGVILAYLVGHILQTVATHAIPSTSDGRHPSATLLDQNDRTFTREFKERLAGQIDKVFQLRVSLDASGTAADGVRNDAFFLCRSALIKSKNAVYPEQFEGMYALMRGLCTAFGIAVVYYLGWAYSGLLQPLKTFRLAPSILSSREWSGPVVLAAVIVAIAGSIGLNRYGRGTVGLKVARLAIVWSILVAGFAAGYYLGMSSASASAHRGQFIAAAVLSFFAAQRCYSGYKAFAQEFAKSVYRDFCNYEKPGGDNQVNSDSESE